MDPLSVPRPSMTLGNTLAGPTPTVSPYIKPRVQEVVGMALQAVGFHPFVYSTISPQTILPRGYRLQMTGVNAMPDSAKVVKVHIFRDRALGCFVGVTMRTHRSPVNLKMPITMRRSITSP